MEDYLAYTALENLKRVTGLDTTYHVSSASQSYDCRVDIGGVAFVAICKNIINTPAAARIIETAKAIEKNVNMHALLISGNISDSVFDLLQAEGISAIETSGNCRIVAPPMYIIVCGQKRAALPKDKTHAYTPARLKVVLYLLQGEGNVNKTFREIADVTDTSLGTVKSAFDDLINKKYIIKTPSGRVLKDVKSLMELWASYYTQTMKPKLFVGNYDFIRDENQKMWRSLRLPEGLAWGGEPAADIIDDFITADTYEIYTSLSAIKLLATGMFRPSKDGKIKMYNMFWKEGQSHTAPLPVVYADLLAIGDSRCREAAQHLIEKL